MHYKKIADEHFLYTDWRDRDWSIWRQSKHGSNQWAMSCREENMGMFNDAFWTRTSCVRQIKYLENPENEKREIDKRKNEN